MPSAYTVGPVRDLGELRFIHKHTPPGYECPNKLFLPVIVTGCA
jgi:hypothetical protein